MPSPVVHVEFFGAEVIELRQPLSRARAVATKARNPDVWAPGFSFICRGRSAVVPLVVMMIGRAWAGDVRLDREGRVRNGLGDQRAVVEGAGVGVAGGRGAEPDQDGGDDHSGAENDPTGTSSHVNVLELV
jgi:hypothetical protein